MVISPPGSDGDVDSGDSVKYDVAGGETETAGDSAGQPPSCKVVGDMDAVQPCTEQAPPDSFDPEVQWSWDGSDGDTDVVATPIVANLTDDNGDGEIDLCDVPDIVVLAYPHSPCFCCSNLEWGDGANDCEDPCPWDPAPPVDADEDGISDCQDPCPADAANLCWGPCPLDQDGDALMDCVDPCPWGEGADRPCIYPLPPVPMTPAAP